MLKNLMEDKQLDFDTPLLSVRRLTSNAASNTEDNSKVEKFQPKKPSLPSYKSELKSGPVRNPGTVPFVWEQIPGRPKDGSGLRPRAPELPPLVPKLPPGRIVHIKQPSSAKSMEDREPEALTVNKPPENKNPSHKPHVLSSIGDMASLERSKRDVKEKHSTDVDDCDGDVFSDALETLSHTESFFMNCSVSGLSALDGRDLRFSGRASTDSQARDFMMDRFLPAAKAIASENPQYASRKQARKPIRSQRKVNIVDEDRLVKSFEEDKQPSHHHATTYHVPHVQDVEEDDDDNDEDYGDTGTLITKGCGILPRFCLKNSLCLLNPVPRMKIRSRMPVSSVRCKVNTHVKATNSEHLTELGLEHTWEAVYKHKLLRGLQPPGTCDDGSKPTSESNQLTYWSDSQTPDGSSPYRHSAGDGISPYRNEVRQVPFRGGMSFLGVPEQGNNYRADDATTYGNSCNDDNSMFSCRSSKQGSGSLSFPVEKTLYVDSVHMIRSSNSGSSPSDSKELMSAAEKDSEILVESERLDKNLILEADSGGSNQVNCFNKRGLLQPNILDTVESNPLSCSEDSIGSVAIDRNSFRERNCLVQKPKSSGCSQELINGSPGCGMPEPLQVDGGNSYTNFLQSPQLPPLPKSPSESWLCRALPSVSSMNPSSRSYLGVQFRSKKHLVKASPVDPKWETIVKTSNAQCKDLRFSEELKIHSCHASES